MSDFWEDVMLNDYYEYMKEQNARTKKTSSSKSTKRKIRYARVASGFETCPFCIMLASRGFVYSTEKMTLSHTHSGCDCRLVPGFQDETVVEGYDPEALYGKYKAARDAVKARYTEAEWANVKGDARTKLILSELGKQIRSENAPSKNSVGAALNHEKQNSESVSFTYRQLGRKIGRHAEDFGLDPSIEEDRIKMVGIIDGIINKPSEIRSGDWRSQPNPCKFFIRDDDVVVVNADNCFVTILKGGAVNNERVKRGRHLE